MRATHTQKSEVIFRYEDDYCWVFNVGLASYRSQRTGSEYSSGWSESFHETTPMEKWIVETEKKNQPTKSNLVFFFLQITFGSRNPLIEFDPFSSAGPWGSCWGSCRGVVGVVTPGTFAFFFCKSHSGLEIL